MLRKLRKPVHEGPSALRIPWADTAESGKGGDTWT